MKFKLEVLTVWNKNKAVNRTEKRRSIKNPLNHALVEAVRNAKDKTAKQIAKEVGVAIPTVYRYNSNYGGNLDVITR